MEDALRQKFAEVLRTAPDPDKKTFCAGLNIYSMRELADEVANGTTFGLEFCDMAERTAKELGESTEDMVQNFFGPPKP